MVNVGDFVEVKRSDASLTNAMGTVSDTIPEAGKFKIKGIERWFHEADLVPKVAVKHDTQKNRLELIPVSGIEAVGQAMTFGAKKYADHNWAHGFKWSRLAGSTLRHMFAWLRGENNDPESGLSHLAHAGACILMLIAHEAEQLGTDDRRKQC